jgi:hypothetical protein
MTQLNITVLSNNPAGGRCTLYTNYAQTLSKALGFEMQTIYPDEDHNLSAPGLLLDGNPVMPNDGFIIDADDICSAIEQTGFNNAELTEVRKKLDSLIEDMMSAV